MAEKDGGGAQGIHFNCPPTNPPTAQPTEGVCAAETASRKAGAGQREGHFPATLASSAWGAFQEGSTEFASVVLFVSASLPSHLPIPQCVEHSEGRKNQRDLIDSQRKSADWGP